MSSSLPKQSPGYAAAAALLRAENPNPVLDGPCDFFEGLEGPSLRFVPFNGGLGDAQLAWLAATLEEAGDAPVVVFSHLPVFAGSNRRETRTARCLHRVLSGS